LKTWRGNKTEDDGLDVSNSQNECFLTATQKLGIEVLTGQSVQSLFKKEQYGK
jgi:hypothetical protein